MWPIWKSRWIPWWFKYFFQVGNNNGKQWLGIKLLTIFRNFLNKIRNDSKIIRIIICILRNSPVIFFFNFCKIIIKFCFVFWYAKEIYRLEKGNWKSVPYIYCESKPLTNQMCKSCSDESTFFIVFSLLVLFFLFNKTRKNFIIMKWTIHDFKNYHVS